VLRIDLTMTWPWIAEKSLDFSNVESMSFIYVDLIQNEFSGQGDVTCPCNEKKNLTMEAVV